MTFTKISIATLATLFAIGLTACERDGPAEQAGENIDNAAENMGDRIEDSTDDARDEVETAGDKVEDATDR